MIVHGIFLQGSAYLIGKTGALSSEVSPSIHLVQYLCCLSQRSHSHEVGWDEKLQCGCIVGRPEGGGYQSYGLNGCPPPCIVHGIQRTVRDAQKPIAPLSLFFLLFAESLEDIPNRLDPFSPKDTCIACHFPVLKGKSDGITERINLVFPFMQFRFHVRLITHPIAVRVRHSVEGIGIRVYVDTFQLSVDDSCQHSLQFPVLAGQL